MVASRLIAGTFNDYPLKGRAETQGLTQTCAGKVIDAVDAIHATPPNPDQ